MMDRLTEKEWRNLDPWECCGQDDYCNRGCHEKGGCTGGCVVPRNYVQLAKYEDSGLTPERAQELAKADESMRLLVMPKLPQDMDDVMEPVKIEAAARSVLMKIDYWKEKDPKKLSVLDYTLYAVCYHALERMRDDLISEGGDTDGKS